MQLHIIHTNRRSYWFCFFSKICVQHGHETWCKWQWQVLWQRRHILLLRCYNNYGGFVSLHPLTVHIHYQYNNRMTWLSILLWLLYHAIPRPPFSMGACVAECLLLVLWRLLRYHSGHIRPKRLRFGFRPPQEPSSEQGFLLLNKFKYSERSGRSGGVPPPSVWALFSEIRFEKSLLGMLGGSSFCANHTMKWHFGSKWALKTRKPLQTVAVFRSFLTTFLKRICKPCMVIGNINCIQKSVRKQ